MITPDDCWHEAQHTITRETRELRAQIAGQVAAGIAASCKGVEFEDIAAYIGMASVKIADAVIAELNAEDPTP